MDKMRPGRENWNWKMGLQNEDQTAQKQKGEDLGKLSGKKAEQDVKKHEINTQLFSSKKGVGN